ncbi:MAG: alpha/beta fold hydrolase, partial [Pseudomonadota bacterium]
DGALAMMAQWSLDRLLDDLPKVGQPTLFLVGERDKAVPPSTADDAAAAMPYARIHRWPDLGHLAHEEAPEAAADAIEDFVVEALAKAAAAP